MNTRGIAGRPARLGRTGVSVLALLAIVCVAGTIWLSLDHHGVEEPVTHQEEPFHTIEIVVVTLVAGASAAVGTRMAGARSLRRSPLPVLSGCHGGNCLETRDLASALWRVRSTVIRV